MKWTRNKLYPNLWSTRESPDSHVLQKGCHFGLPRSSVKSSACSQGYSDREELLSAACLQSLSAMRADGKYHRLWRRASQVLAPKSWSGLRKSEENFVPFLINGKLCNITQMVLFLKDSQQLIHFKYFNTVKKKETKTWKTIICYIKHQYIANKWFTLCVLLHVPKMHISWITDSRHPFS